jgi:hypothetical protein
LNANPSTGEQELPFFGLGVDFPLVYFNPPGVTLAGGWSTDQELKSKVGVGIYP